MAFQDVKIARQSVIKPGQISIVSAYINATQVDIPWKYVQFQVDPETSAIRIIESTEDKGYEQRKAVDARTGRVDKKIGCAGLISNGAIAKGVYQLTNEQEPNSFTFRFVRPSSRFIKKG